jgi:hypothetical protein
MRCGLFMRRKIPSLILLFFLLAVWSLGAFGVKVNMEHWTVMGGLGMLVIVQGVLLVLFANKEATEYQDSVRGFQEKHPKLFFAWSHPAFIVLAGIFLVFVGLLIAVGGLVRRH